MRKLIFFFHFQSKDTHRSTSSNSYDGDRRSTHQNEQRLRHEKEILVHKQLVQQQEEEKIKEQQRRLAEERERVRREFECKSFFAFILIDSYTLFFLSSSRT